MYCNLISPQFVGDSTVRSMRTFVFKSWSSPWQHEFRKVYYVPVDQRKLQDIRIEFLTTEGLHIPFEDSTTPTKVVLHFRKIYKFLMYTKRGVAILNKTLISIHPLEVYYQNHVGRSLTTPGIGPVYSATHYLHRSHRIAILSAACNVGSATPV